MALLSLEHSPTAHRADLALYSMAVVTLAALLLWVRPQGQALVMAAWVGAGVIGWSLLEYLLHRFVLHGLPPFSRWHAMHHARPTALIGAPTALSAALFATLGLLLALLWGNAWSACALTLGLLLGYLAYAITHHAVHHATEHGRSRSRWLRRRKQWHAQHHLGPWPAYGVNLSAVSPPSACFGVTSRIWDQVFGTGRR